MTTEDKIKIFQETFKGRNDAYGAGEGLCVKERVTDEIIKAHLTGKKRIGQYPLSPDIMDGAGTYWLCLDIDEHDVTIALEALGAIEGLGFSAYLEISKSKGWHIWTFFSERVKASDARGLGQYVAEVVWKTFEDAKLEIFPKQNSLKNTPYGNYVNLPLFGQDVKDGRTVFVNPENGFKPFENQWELLSNIVKVTPEELEDIIESEGLETPEEESMPEVEVETNDYADMLPCVPKMMQGVSEGCRDVVAFTLAKHFRVEKKLPADATLAILQAWNQKNTPPLSDKDLQIKIKSAYTGKGGKGYTSLGCDVDLIQQFCEKDSCSIFQKKKNPYFIAQTFIPKRLADELMNENRFIYSGEQLHIYQDGVYVSNGERFVRHQCRKKLGDAARVHRLNEVIAHISDMTFVETDELNTHTNLINLQNGMYDWIEEKLLSHDPKYLSTIRIPVEYKPEATCPTVNYFFNSTLPSDCIPIAEELFGYALIPDTLFERAFMFTGTGANGKSTFLNLLEGFVGVDNVSKVPLQELDENRFKRAELFGKLVNLFADLDSRALKSSSYFKTIVTGDAIDAERKHRDPFSFRPFSRLAYSANQLPYSYDKTFAYYRRWVIIPFPHKFIGKNDDKSLKYKLTKPNELSGLLNRALAGLNRLFENQDFSDSETIKDALEDYKKQNDTVAAFVADCCEFDQSAKTERTAVYDAYTTYCENEGFEAVSRRACYDRIRAYAQVNEQRESNARYFWGIRVGQM